MTTQPEPPQSPPPAVIVAGGVYLPADVCYPLWRVMRDHLARHRADGGHIRPEVVAALDALRSAGLIHMSAHGHPERTSADIEPPSDRELIRTEQLAVRLGVTERHARRLAARAGITPATRNAWHPDDVAHIVQLRRNAGCPPPAQRPTRSA